jgi:hypothetical protein
MNRRQTVTTQKRPPVYSGQKYVGRCRRLAGALAMCVAIALGMVSTAVAGGDANMAQCPNEALPGFRTYLPDCRAYEMVSPSYTQGFPVSISAVAEGGSSLVGKSEGVFAGAQGTSGAEGIAYQFSRAGTGWEATPLNPPGSMYFGTSTWYATTPDASETLWSMPTPPVGQADYYVRRQNGTFIDVGPITPPADGPTVPPAPEGTGPTSNDFPFEGASEDLSHIVFLLEAPAATWPGDGTRSGKSLYEYAGHGESEPLLVAVSGGPGSKSLIGECGAYLGGSQSEYNALSANGSAVFFTPSGADEQTCGGVQPPVDELYARIDQSQTVKISAPSPIGCTTPACEGAPASDALFEGASRDGSKAFFTSTQQLTDQASEDSTSGDSAVGRVGSGCPEAQGSGCNLYEYDFANPPGENLVTVSAGSASPHVQGVVRISEDGSHVYFVAEGVLTGAPNTQEQTAQAGANNLYVFERDAQFPAGRTSFIATLSPSDEEVWGERANNDRRPAQTTPDGRFLVFQSHADLTPDDSSNGVWQVFEYDALSGNLVRVSIGQNGFNDNGNTSQDSATIPAPQHGPGGGGDQPQQLAVTEDGARVVFQSADGLTPQALNNVTIDGAGDKANNIYEYHDGGVFLISDGKDVGVLGGSSVGLFGTTASGGDIYFSTDDQLLAQDGNTIESTYDVRVEGGFPEPSEAAPCQGEACQGASSPPPALAAPQSNTLTASGNLIPRVEPKPTVKPKAKRCKKGFVKHKGKCVKAPKSKKAKKAATKRGAKS